MSSAGLVPVLIDDPDDIPIGSPPIPQSMSFVASSQGPVRAYGLGRMRSSSAVTSSKAVSAHEAAEYKYLFPSHNDKYHPRPQGTYESSILEPNYDLHFSSNNYTTTNSNYLNTCYNNNNNNNSSAINFNNRRRTVMGLQSLVTTTNTTISNPTASTTTSTTTNINNNNNNNNNFNISEQQQQQLTQKPPQEQRKQSTVDVPRRLVNRTSMEFLLTSAKDSEEKSAGADVAVIAKGKDGQDEPTVRRPSSAVSITSVTSRKESNPFRGLRKDSETIPPDFSSAWDEEEGLQEMPASAGRQRRRRASVIVSPTDSRRKADDWFEEDEIVRRGSKASIHDHRLSMPIVKMADLDKALDDLNIDDDSDTDTIVDGKVPSSRGTPTIIELAEEPEPKKSKGKFRMQPDEILAAPLGGKRQHRKSLSLFPLSNRTITETTSVSMPSSPSGSGFPSSRPIRPIAALPAMSFQTSSRCYVEYKKDPKTEREIASRLAARTAGSKDPEPIPRPISAAAPPGSPFRQNFQGPPDSPYAERFDDNAGEGSSRSAALAMFYNGQFGRPTSQPPVPRNQQQQQQVPYVELRNGGGRRRHRSFSFENDDRNSHRLSQISLPPTYEEAVNRNHVCYPGGPGSGSSTSLPGSGESEDEDDSFQRRSGAPSTPRRRFFARIFRSTSNSGNSNRRRRRRDSNTVEGEQPPPYEAERVNNGSSSSLDNIIGTEEPNFDCAACEVRYPFSKIIQAPACGCTYCRSCMKTKFQLSISHASVRPSNVSIPVLCCAAEIPPSILEDTDLLSPAETAEYLRLLHVRQKEQDHMIALQMSVVDEPYQTCPSANCGLPVEWSAGGGTVRITCYCGTEFCFSCGKVWGGFKGGCEGMCS